jgi:proline-specific peptidase
MEFSEKGFIQYRGYKVWYGVVGESEVHGKHPVLCLHGGPGASHDYLTPLGKLSDQGRKVVFYDQLGAGRSDHPDNPDMWTVELYVEEVDVVRNALGLEKLHIFGQSWGGQLALEYAITGPTGLDSLILADSLADMSQWITEANRLRSELPQEIQDIMDKHEAEGTTDDPEYEEAAMEFYKRHVCRLDEWPAQLDRSFEMLERYPQVYETMWGPNEFSVTGTLKNWSFLERLKDIKLPTLIVSGKYDESTPMINDTMNKGISGSEWVLFENSAHIPHLEETTMFLKVVNEFLCKVEA